MNSSFARLAPFSPEQLLSPSDESSFDVQGGGLRTKCPPVPVLAPSRRLAVAGRMSKALVPACVALLFASIGSCAHAGSAEAYEAGRRGDYATALREFQPLAEQGDRDAQFALGDMYSRGYGVPVDDTIAARWFRKAADQGDSRLSISTKIYRIWKLS